MPNQEEKKENTHPLLLNKERKSRHEKEMKQMKWLKIGGITVFAIIILVLVFGVFYEYQYLPNKTIAKVQDKKITVKEFQEAVRYQRVNLISNYNYMAQLYQSFGMQMDEETKSQYEIQLSEPYAGILGQQVYNTMVNQLILEYGAKAAGITVSDAEVDNEIQSMWGYYPNGTPTPRPSETPFANTPTVSEEQLKLLNYTETPTPTTEITDLTSLKESGPEANTPVVTDTPTLSPTATQTEVSSESPTPVLSPTPSLTPTTYTEEMFQNNFNRQFENNPYYSKEFFRKQVYYQLLEQKVRDMLAKDIEPEAEMVWARHILVSTEDEAKKVIERLNNGEDWNALAAEVSTDTSNNTKGGDLGWFMKGVMDPDFEKAAFEQEVGTYSKEPVKTQYGYHVIQVIGHEVRPLTSTDRSNAIDRAYKNWLENAKSNLKIETGSDWVDFVPVEPTLSDL